MNKKCPNCRLVNYADASECVRCEAVFDENTTTIAAGVGRKPSILTRVVVCIAVCFVLLIGFYLSLIGSSKSLTFDQKSKVRDSIAIVRSRGFETEAMMLEKFAVYRASDSWFNSMVPKENAFAATNFPFEIMTLYPDFFTYPVDETERAAILLHEARHLQGKDEKDAYEFVWKNRVKLGWTKDKYFNSPVWDNVRNQTREYAPSLFICKGSDFSDCTE
ncbi:MAG: hypothetical protein ABL999_18905 [Pyrinomonadaceae bacterium]